MKKLLIAFILSMIAVTAYAAAEQVQLGYLTTTGCPGATSPCYVPYSSTNPMPVQLTITR